VDERRLRSIPLFEAFDPADLERIAVATGECRLAAGDWLFEEGEDGDHAYVIVEGEIEILKRSGRRDVLLALRGPGDVIGEMSLLEDAPRMAGARARVDAVLLDVPKEVLDAVLDSSAGASRALFGVLVARWRETEARLRQREQLAQLGTLSAGLAHEINNPAAAALRAASSIPPAIDAWLRAVAAALRGAGRDAEAGHLERLAAAERSRLKPLDRADREDELLGRLERLGVGEPRSAAASLAVLDQEVVDAALDGLGGDAVAAAVVGIAAARVGIAGSASVVSDAAGRISGLVEAVKSFAFLDRAPIQEVDLAAMLDDTVLLLGHRLGDIEVVRDYEDVPAFPAYGAELNQVWSNLIDNAVDAVREAGRRPGRIVLRLRSTSEEAVVEISDDGPGIPDDVLPRIFDSFFTTKPPGSGTGLGLDICYGIVVHRHGGEIEVDTEPGRTTIRVRSRSAGPAEPAPGPSSAGAQAVSAGQFAVHRTHAGVHDDRQPCGLSDPAGFLRDDAELQPQQPGADGDCVPGDGRCLGGGAEHIDGVDPAR
jgi:signal transduction histidine kinase